MIIGVIIFIILHDYILFSYGAGATSAERGMLVLLAFISASIFRIYLLLEEKLNEKRN